MTTTEFVQLVQEDQFRRMVRVALRMKDPTQSPAEFHKEYISVLLDTVGEEILQYAESVYQVEAIQEASKVSQ